MKRTDQNKFSISLVLLKNLSGYKMKLDHVAYAVLYEVAYSAKRILGYEVPE